VLRFSSGTAVQAKLDRAYEDAFRTISPTYSARKAEEWNGSWTRSVPRWAAGPG